jgi:hypothetical protein
LPRRKHRSNDRRYLITIGEQSFDPSVERNATDGAEQHSERLQHTPDLV